MYSRWVRRGEGVKDEKGRGSEEGIGGGESYVRKAENVLYQEEA